MLLKGKPWKEKEVLLVYRWLYPEEYKKSDGKIPEHMLSFLDKISLNSKERWMELVKHTHGASSGNRGKRYK